MKNSGKCAVSLQLYIVKIIFIAIKLQHLMFLEGQNAEITPNGSLMC